MATTLGPAGTKWYPGTIVAVHDDEEETVDVEFDDGDFEEHVKREYVHCVRPCRCTSPAV